jgi:hypothetical protein
MYQVKKIPPLSVSRLDRFRVLVGSKYREWNRRDIEVSVTLTLRDRAFQFEYHLILLDAWDSGKEEQ